MGFEDNTYGSTENTVNADQLNNEDVAAFNEHLSQKKKNKIMDFVEKLGKNFDNKDVDKVNSDITSMNKGALANVWDKVLFLLKSFNENSSPKDKALIIGALLYAILPVDIIPDVIPGLGLVDDAFAVVMVYNIVKKAVPIVKKAVQEKVVKKIDNIISWAVEQQLDLVYNRKLVSSLFNLILFIFAILFTVCPVFGNPASSIIASILLLTSVVLAIISIVKTLRNKHTIPLIRSIWKQRSIKRGIAEYIRNLNEKITFGEKTIDDFFTLLGEPANQRFLDHLVDHCWLLIKKSVIHFILVIVCVVASFFIVRQALLLQFSDLSFWQMIERNRRATEYSQSVAKRKVRPVSRLKLMLSGVLAGTCMICFSVWFFWIGLISNF